MQKIKINNVIFLDFYATWCGPCINFSSVYEKISGEYSEHAKFLKINVVFTCFWIYKFLNTEKFIFSVIFVKKIYLFLE